MLNHSFRRRTPVMLQTEVAECGLACLAMVASYHGHQIDLASLRARHGLSQRGSTLAELMRLAGQLDLAPRPLRLELSHLRELKLPCVLHWDFSHFVVLTRVRGQHVVLHDPAQGRRDMTLAEFSKHFTGVALELSPQPQFRPRVERRRLSLASLVGRLDGLGGAVLKVLGLALVLQLFSLLAPFHMQWVVDQALVSQDRDLLSVLGLGFALLVLVQCGVTALRGWVLMVLGSSLNLQMARNLFRHLIRLPMAWFDRRHVGDVVSRFESLNAIQRTLSTGLLEALVDGTMALATLGAMLYYSASLAAVAALAAAAYAGLRLALYQPQRQASEAQIVRAAHQQSHFLETVRGMQSIKLLGHEDARSATWQNLAVSNFNAGLRGQRLGLLHQAMNGLLFGLENVVTLWLGALLVLDGARSGGGFTVGMLFAFMSYKTQFVQRVAGLVEKGLELRMLNLHTERVADVALADPEARSAADALAAADAPPLAGAIRVRELSFRHGPTDAPLLQGLDFEIRAGESVAITGPSGCGKTTLVKLLLGLLQPCSGSIEVDGVPLSQLGMARWRRSVACVMQDDPLFAGSIAENISFFDPRPDPAWVEACARAAAVHADIVTMPMQYNTLVGDMGSTLSGGQKQRILLARALYRRPSVLVLDEATSHLDLARERCVNEAVRALKLTRIIVAHRPQTIASADRCIVLGGAAGGATTPLRETEALSA